MLQDLWRAITAAMNSWHQGKLFVEHLLTISHDTLHLLVGVLLWIVFGLVSGRPLTSLRPWLWLFAIILWNETVDLTVEHWPDRGKQYGEGMKDILLTMAVPAVLMFLARGRPDLFRSAAGRRRR